MPYERIKSCSRLLIRFLDFLHCLSINTHFYPSTHSPTAKMLRSSQRDWTSVQGSRQGQNYLTAASLRHKRKGLSGLWAAAAVGLSWRVSCPERTEEERRNHLTVAAPAESSDSDDRQQQRRIRAGSRRQTNLLTSDQTPLSFTSQTHQTAPASTSTTKAYVSPR